jgi:hypothetical protein
MRKIGQVVREAQLRLEAIAADAPKDASVKPINPDRPAAYTGFEISGVNGARWSVRTAHRDLSQGHTVTVQLPCREGHLSLYLGTEGTAQDSDSTARFGIDYYRQGRATGTSQLVKSAPTGNTLEGSGNLTGIDRERFKDVSDMVRRLGGFESMAALPPPIRKVVVNLFNEVPIRRGSSDLR